MVDLDNGIDNLLNKLIGNTYMQNANFFRVYDNNYIISYGFRITDDGKLELYKHDSRVQRTTLVNTFGFGDLILENTQMNNANDEKIDSMLNENKLKSNFFGKSIK